MKKDSIRKSLWHSRKNICILPNFKVKKSVYTDKISLSGRSDLAHSSLNPTTVKCLRHCELVINACKHVLNKGGLVSMRLASSLHPYLSKEKLQIFT